MARRGAKLGTSVLDLDVDDSKFHSKLSGAYKAAQGFTDQTGKDLQKAGKAISDVGGSWTRNVTLPIVAAGAAVGKLGLDFDTTLRQIVGLTDVTADEIGGIRDQLLKLAPEVGKGPQELAEAFYFVASAGFDAEGAMKVLRASAQAAASGLGETQAVAQVVGSVLNAYGQENLDAADAVGQLVEAISQGTAEAPEFASVIGRVTPTAANLGVSFDQVASALAGMTLTGLSAEEAATSLNQVLISLLKPTVQAEDAMEGLGLSSAGLRRQLREEGLLATLRTLEERFAGNEEASAQVFGNVRALRGVTALLSLETDQLNTIFEKVASSGAPRLAQAYEDTEGPQRDIDRSMADLQATAIELGEDVLPLVVEVLQELAAGARGLAEWWNDLDDETRQLIVRALAFLAVAGPVLIIFGKLTTATGQLFTVIRFLIGAKGIPLLATKLKLLGTAALGPLGIIISLGVALHELDKAIGGNASDKLQRFADELEGIGVSGEEANEAIKESGLSLHDFVERFIELVDAGHSASDALRMVRDGVDELEFDEQERRLTEAGEAWETYQEQIGGAARGATDDAADALGDLPPEVQQALAAAGIAIDTGAGEAFDGVDEEAAKARDAAIARMKEMLAGISNLFDSDDSVREAWQELIDRMDDPYTEAERKADIFSQNTIDNIRAALKSGDPAIQADTVTLVNNMLAQIALMEPGALESGEAVPPAVRKGMDSQMSALIAWIETNVTHESLEAMSLEDAQDLGLEGIWLYAQGIKANRYRAFLEALGVKGAVKDALTFNAYSGGYSVVGSWIDGMTGAWNQQQWRIHGMVGTAASIFGQSLPTRGPMKGGVGSGGFSVGESWIDGIVDAIGGGMPTIESSVGSIGDALDLSHRIPRLALPDMAGVSALGGDVMAPGGLGGTVTQITNIYQLHYNGAERTFDSGEALVREVEALARFRDGGLG